MAEERVVKLQRVKGLTVGEKTYYRWQLTLPMEVVDTLGWKQGNLIAVEAKGDRVVLRRRVLAPD